MVERLSLEQLASKYLFVLPDTCALFGSLVSGIDGSNGNTIGERLSISKERKDSASLFRKFIKINSGFYVTGGVLGEYSLRSHYPSQKLIEMMEKNHSEVRDPLCMIMKRKTQAEEIGVLIKELKINRRVLQFDDNEMKTYGSLMEKYRNFLVRFRLKETKYDLLISGSVLSERRGPTCVISNNFQFLYSWRKFLKSEGISPENFGFFLRMEYNGFERAKSPYS